MNPTKTRQRLLRTWWILQRIFTAPLARATVMVLDIVATTCWLFPKRIKQLLTKRFKGVSCECNICVDVVKDAYFPDVAVAGFEAFCVACGKQRPWARRYDLFFEFPDAVTEYAHSCSATGDYRIQNAVSFLRPRWYD
jgi:hypothetical protein